MFAFLINNTYVAVDDQVFQQFIEIPMGTNCTQLSGDLFLHFKRQIVFIREEKCLSNKYCYLFGTVLEDEMNKDPNTALGKDDIPVHVPINAFVFRTMYAFILMHGQKYLLFHIDTIKRDNSELSELLQNI